MILLSASDFHLGKGKFLENGQKNVHEDFFEDEDFNEFLRFYTYEKYPEKEITLVLNGDIFNLIQIDHDGVFSDIMDEEHVCRSLKKIKEGHPLFFEGLKRFNNSDKRKVVFTIGNHDAGLIFSGAKDYLCQELGDVDVVDNYEVQGIYFEHGHRFEAINAVPIGGALRKSPSGKECLNLPWGSLFCVNVLPKLKKERPYIDRVRPLKSYIIWCLLHDLFFFFKLSKEVLSYLWRANTEDYSKGNRNYKTTLKILKQITIYPRYESKAKSILKKRPYLKAVVMGHTHLVEWRRFSRGQLYFNTGTWNSIPNVDAGLHQEHQSLTYVEMEVEKTGLVFSSIRQWRGVWSPFKSEVFIEEV